MSSSSYKLSKIKSKVQNEAVSIDLREEERDGETYESSSSSSNVSSMLYLKPTHTSETLDKEVVLHRIRQRKRANRLRAALQSLLTSSILPSARDKKKWVDDAFAAP